MVKVESLALSYPKAARGSSILLGALLAVGIVVLDKARVLREQQEAQAARDGSGNYTLPVNSVNPAVAGTPIKSADFNATMNDFKTEMTDSLSRSGKGAMTANLGVRVTPAWPLHVQGPTASATQARFGASGDSPITIYSNTAGPNIGANATNDGSTGWKYATSNASLALAIEMGGNGYVFYTAPSGTAGNAVTFTERARIGTAGLTIGTGVGPDGSGFKHQSHTGCATGAAIGATCTDTLTWTTAFANGTYQAVCSCNAVTSGLPIIRSYTNSGDGVSITITTMALTAAAAQCSVITCFAAHD